MSRTIIEDRSLCIRDIAPQDDMILIEGRTNEETSSGIILPKGEKTECWYGKVLACGPGKENPVTGDRYPIPFKKGDWLLVMGYTGADIEVGGKKYKIIREAGVWAKLKVSEREGRLEILEVEPYRGKALCKMRDLDVTRSGLLHLPTNPQVKYTTARVVRVGPGLRNLKTGVIEEMGVKPGDEVLVERYGGADVLECREKYRILEWMEVYAIVEE